MLYPQNGDRIVVEDSVTSLHPVCSGSIAFGKQPSVAATGTRMPHAITRCYHLRVTTE